METIKNDGCVAEYGAISLSLHQDFKKMIL
jgi:hypothetical protein